MSDPDMGVWTYEYDLLGNLLKQTDAKGQVLEFEYDDINRLTKKSSIVNLQTSILATYYYDEVGKPNCIGRLSKITDQSGSTEFFYDRLGREIKSIKTVKDTSGVAEGLPGGGVGYSVERQYDILDRLTKLTYPDGEEVNYSYDTNSGLLEKVSNSTNYVNSIDYNAKGQIKTIQYGNNTKTGYTYGQDLRLSRILTSGVAGGLPGGGVGQDLNYIFDKNGNITTLTDNLRSNIRTYAYDDLDRLTTAQNVPAPGGGYTNFNYQYDSIGNMTYKSDVGVMTYGLNAGPHALTGAGAYSYQYDANGNMTVGKNKTMQYDAENRLVKVNTYAVAGGLRVGEENYFYDGDGGRVQKAKVRGDNTEITTYIGSLYEVESDGTIRKHIFAGANRVCTVTNNSSLITYNYYHSDHLGSSSIITDATGNQIAHYEYTPYGSLAVNELANGQTGQPVNHYFTGKELDSTGLYFYGARYYDPEIGRFITADTIVQSPYDPQSLNRYSYCRNNPLNYIDPTGHSWFSKFFKNLGKAIASNPGAFIAGLAVGLIVAWAIAPMISGLSSAMATSGAGTTFWEGFVLGGMELGIPAFSGTLAGGLAGGEKFSTALKNAAIVGGTTFVAAGLIEGAYAAGWQDKVHFRDVRTDSVKAQMEKYNELALHGRFQEAMDVKISLMKNYDFYAWGTTDIIKGVSAFEHVEAIASMTTGEFAGVKFDWVGKGNPLNLAKVLTSNSVKGTFSAIDRSTFINTRYTLLSFQSASSQVVNQALKTIPTFVGREANYILYGVGTYTCFQGVSDVDVAIKNSLK